MSNYKLEVENTEKLKTDISLALSTIKNGLLNSNMQIDVSNLNDLANMIADEELIPREFQHTYKWDISNSKPISKTGGCEIFGEFKYKSESYFVANPNFDLFVFKRIGRTSAEVVYYEKDFNDFNSIATLYLDGSDIYICGQGRKFNLDTLTISSVPQIDTWGGVGYDCKERVITMVRATGGFLVKIINKETLTILGEFTIPTKTPTGREITYVVDNDCGKVMILIYINSTEQLMVEVDLNSNTYVQKKTFSEVSKYAYVFENKIHSYSNTDLKIFDLLTDTIEVIDTPSTVYTTFNHKTARIKRINIDGKNFIHSLGTGTLYDEERKEFNDMLVKTGFTGDIIEGNKLLMFNGRANGEPFIEHYGKLVKEI